MLKNPTAKIVNKEYVGEVKGMLAIARMSGATVVHMVIPVYLLGIDPSYQFPGRTERDMSYLVDNWDERLLEALTVVPHPEEGRFVITDGYGRLVASQKVDAKKYASLTCRVIMNAPEDIEERRKFEADLYVRQNKNVALLKPYHKHEANIILDDKATIDLDKAVKKYDYKYPVVGKGRRGTGTIGSYSGCLRVAKKGGFDALDYVFAITKASAFDRQMFGLSSYVIKGLSDMYFLYGNKYRRTEKYFGGLLRATTPVLLIANARTAYPYQDTKMAVSLYLEDKLTGASGVNRRRYEDPTTRKVIILDNANVAGQSA